MSDQHTIKPTADGSTTLVSKRFNQPFHSLHGAVAESRYLYFEMNGLIRALQQETNEPLVVLESGFGTGLNLFLLMEYCSITPVQRPVHFLSSEKYPVSAGVAKQLSFDGVSDAIRYRDHLSAIVANLQPGANRFQLTERVTLHLFVGGFKDAANRTEEKAHFILHDPFSPEANPEGWQPELFTALHAAARPEAVLSTYCAAVAARASMAVGGWYLHRAPGALGKREMTLATPTDIPLAHAKPIQRNRLIERYQNGEFAR
ncbi:MAG: tRNA (5-methylaminomethyl-2-thiouridine)(34)-methyltransferase MnmD [Balneolaceae bacterium]